MPERIYNEEEIAKLLKRAAELETERSVSRDNGFKNGLSLNELAQIASESGIDPELVQRAASELETSGKTSPSTNKDVSIKRDEIVCERWVDVSPDARTLDELVTELNHMYGTSDSDISWWDKLWDDYSGKAKVRKTTSSLEWIYTDEYGYYTTRVLFQKRNSKFRIRVSKRQLWGMEWDSTGTSYIVALPSLVVLIVIGAVISNLALGTAWPGILAGIGLTLITMPFYNMLNKRHINKHKNRVIETADELAQLAIQLSAENRRRESEQGGKSKPVDLIEIEIRDENETPENVSLKNKLRDG
jgi:hypothetical protein